MRPVLILSAALLLAGQAPGALADTMVKCVGGDGKVAYSNQACPGQMSVARQFTIPPSETAEQSAARLAADSARLRHSDAQFKQRHARRTRELDARRGAIQKAPVAATGAPAAARTGATRKAAAIAPPPVASPSGFAARK